MKQRRVRRESFDRIEQGHEFLILDLDQSQCLLGNLFGIGGNRRHLFAGEADHVICEHRHVVNLPADLDPPSIPTDNDGSHPRQF